MTDTTETSTVHVITDESTDQVKDAVEFDVVEGRLEVYGPGRTALATYAPGHWLSAHRAPSIPDQRTPHPHAEVIESTVMNGQVIVRGRRDSVLALQAAVADFAG
jgi:hypothetical protein